MKKLTTALVLACANIFLLTALYLCALLTSIGWLNGHFLDKIPKVAAIVYVLPMLIILGISPWVALFTVI